MRSSPHSPVFLGSERRRSSRGCAPLLVCLVACGGGGDEPSSESLQNRPEAGADDVDSSSPGAAGDDAPGGSGSEQASDDAQGANSDAAAAEGADADGCCVDAEDANIETPDDAVATLVDFQDPDSDFSSVDVFDADREIFHFDAGQSAMISAATGARESAWANDGNQLGSGGRFGTFMVRFGTEQGERRAYFTEVGAGTICNLELERDEALSIFATSELPPSE